MGSVSDIFFSTAIFFFQIFTWAVQKEFGEERVKMDGGTFSYDPQTCAPLHLVPYWKKWWMNMMRRRWMNRNNEPKIIWRADEMIDSPKNVY